MFDGFVLCSSELLAYFAASIWFSFLISQIPGPPVGQSVPTVSAASYSQAAVESSTVMAITKR
jgi:hypothetical protein